METREQPEIRFEIRLSDHPLPAAERTQVMAAPGFGSVFTDHMVTLRLDRRSAAGTTAGWSRTGRSPSTRPRPCSTTGRRSSRA